MLWRKGIRNINISNIKNSIIFRLAVTYAIASTVLLTLVCIGVNTLLNYQFSQDNARYMDDTVYLLKTILTNNEILSVIRQQIPKDLAAFHFNKYQLRILDTDNTLLFESAGFPVVPQDVVQQLVPYGENDPLGPGIQYRTKSGDIYRVLRAWARLGKTSRQKVLMEIAVDITHRVHIFQACQRGLSYITIAGVLLSILLSYEITLRGLSPLREMARKIESIRFHVLEQRLNETAWPTELTGVAIAFDKLLENIEQGINRLSRFSADLAHELRTPITNLRVETEVLLQNPRSMEEYQTTLNSNLEEYERLSGMIDRLLFLAKAENPETKLQMEAFSLKPEIDKLIDFFEIISEEKAIRIESFGTGELRADRALFGWALNNLLSNSIKYTLHGGRIIVKAYSDSSTGEINVEVSDSGIGIAPEDLPKVFDRFYRADLSRSQVVKGDGLGLSIVKSIMDLHEGHVDISSATGKGTCVTLRFPSKTVT